MPYGTSNRRNGNNHENLDRHLKIDDPLTSHLKPVKIGEDQTGLQLADKDVKVEGTLTIDGDISVLGEIDGGSNDNNLKGKVFIGNENGDNFAFTGSVLNIGEPQSYGVSTGSIARLGTSLLGTASTLTLYSRADVQDSFIISTDANGATNIISNDQGASGAYITIQADGDLTLNAENGILTTASEEGKWRALVGGTQYSAADSAYAGMILAYADIGLDEAAATYNLTTSYGVPTDEFGLTFVAPPSGKVEIEIQIGMDVGSSNVGDLYAGLSTANATSGYAQLHDYHEVELFDGMSRGALRVIRHSWTLTGLTAGTSYSRWVGFKTSNTSGTPHLQWGGNATGEYPDFIMKVIALPLSITT